MGWALGKSQSSDLDAEVAPVGSASSGVAAQCESWSEQICSETGKESAACSQAKGAADLLPPGVCNVALKQMPATLAQVKAARASCDGLVAKLCKDLGEKTETCTMVKTKTASFPPAQCREMLKNYDKVLSQLQRLSQRRMMGAPGDSPHGAMRPGASPHGAMPPGTSPHGATPPVAPPPGPAPR